MYDLMMTAYVSPGMYQAGIFREGEKALFGLSDQAAFAAAVFAGLWVGTLILGSIADRYGRRAIFTFALLWYATATLIMACQDTAEGIFLWRFVAGIGLGLEMVTIDTFIAELVCRNPRDGSCSRVVSTRHCVLSNRLRDTWHERQAVSRYQ
ncbi:MFS transporter [Mycobacterium sp.]|uniref:MFS transporter n=1 Tax=Mycobacterium sp. TaxID=1785 RepID=UPI003BAD2232